MPRRNADPATLADRDAEDRAHREDDARAETAYVALLAELPVPTWETCEYPAWFERPMPEPRPDKETKR